MPISAELSAEEIPVIGKEFSFVESDLSESLASTSTASASEANPLTLGREFARPRRDLFPIYAAIFSDELYNRGINE